MELTDQIPFGLILCRMNGKQVTVTAVSDNFARVRLAEESGFGQPEFLFLDMRDASWQRCIPESAELRSINKTEYGYEALVEIRDAAYRQSVLRALRDYAAYIRLKSEEDGEVLMRELTGASYREKTSETLEKQKKSWFSGISGNETNCKAELALSLSDPSHYQRFLTMPWDEFFDDFRERSGFAGHPLFGNPVRRIYFGNACCFRLLPERIRELTDRCEKLGLCATLVLPPIRESRRSDFVELVKCFEKSGADEIAVNDLGALQYLSDTDKKKLLGTQLNRRRKDPRLPYKLGIGNRMRLLAENNLNDEEYASCLFRLGVTRFEYEACGYPVTVAPGRHSLHLPFYQTNTSHGCPLASACHGTDPGLLYDEKQCEMPCLGRAMLYPDDLHLTGRYNSLFAADTGVLTNAEVLEGWLKSGIDRIVVEPL